MNGGDLGDIMFGGDGKDTMNGDAGNDAMFGGDGADTMSGGEGNDLMFGGNGGDTMTGDAGNDTLFGNSGDDTITTSLDQDTIDAGKGDDLIIIFGGENGNGEGNETYATGGTGVNYFQFMAGAYGDLELESEGEDTLDFSGYDHEVSIDMSSTARQEVSTWTDGVDTWSLFVTLKGLFTNLIGSNYDDTLVGNSLVNTIEGRDGNDKLSGREGVDNIYGGDQTDALNSYDLTDGYDIDLDAIPYVGGVTHEDNWYSIEGPVALTGGGGGGGGVLPLVPFGVGGLGLGVIIPVTGADPIWLDCGGVVDRAFTLQLPNGDEVTISGLCATGENNYWAALTAEELATLPLEVTGSAFGAGMTLNLLQETAPNQLDPLTVAPAGVQIEYSFLLRPDLAGKTPGEMFWDTSKEPGDWLTLPDYTVQDGAVVSTAIHPDLGDGLTILSGAAVVGDRLTITTNFPGTFLQVGG